MWAKQQQQAAASSSKQQQAATSSNKQQQAIASRNVSLTFFSIIVAIVQHFVVRHQRIADTQLGGFKVGPDAKVAGETLIGQPSDTAFVHCRGLFLCVAVFVVFFFFFFFAFFGIALQGTGGRGFGDDDMGRVGQCPLAGFDAPRCKPIHRFAPRPCTANVCVYKV